MEIIIDGLKAFKEYKKDHRWYVDFTCVCGKVGTTLRKHFLSRHTKSCGCRRAKIHNKKSTPLLPRTTISNVLYNQYVRDANNRGIEFTLGKSKFIKLVSNNCFYCGVEPSNTCKHRGEVLLYNGVDRIDSEKGYHEKNTVPCCRKCNMGKYRMSSTEFLDWIKRVYNFNYGFTQNSVNSMNILGLPNSKTISSQAS